MITLVKYVRTESERSLRISPHSSLQSGALPALRKLRKLVQLWPSQGAYLLHSFGRLSAQARVLSTVLVVMANLHPADYFLIAADA